MGAFRGYPDPTGAPRRPFILPPSLDMGSLKLDDLQFDIEKEVARLRATHTAQPDAPRPAPR